MNKSKEELLRDTAVALASGLAIEASVHKPGTASPLKSAKELYHQGFIITSIALSHKLYEFLDQVYGGGGCADLGEVIRDLYHTGERLHEMGNLHLGFVILITPIAAGIASIYRSEIDLLKHSTDHISLVTDRSYEYLLKCGYRSKSTHILEVIKRIYSDKIPVHSGPTPDVYSLDIENRSFWDLVLHGRRVDLILLELYEKYRRVRRYARILLETSERDLYSRILVVFLDSLREYIDTHIARTKNILRGAIIRDVVRYCLSRKDLLSEKCLEELDSYLREENINPGSTADIIATAISLRNLVRYVIAKLF
ncbi:MAG: triphosphoribosyl-dephospho-CoA synthase [Sulfolobales archaeon]